MIRPEPQVIKILAQIVKQYPEFLAWLENVLVYEMKRLPYTIENSTIFQGRCQMLIELIEVMKESPTVAAKS